MAKGIRFPGFALAQPELLVITTQPLYSTSAITWTQSTPAGTTVTVQASIDGDTWTTVAASGNPIPQLTLGDALDGINLSIRVQFTSTGTNTPSFSNLQVSITATIPALVKGDTGANATISATAPSTFSRVSGSFITDGFLPGGTISVTGFSNGANNSTFTIATVTALSMTITQATLVTEAGTGDERIQMRDYYAGGLITWTSGSNINLSMEVKEWFPVTREILLFLPAPYTIVAGDDFTIRPGCDKRVETCLNKFNNVPNFRGEPHLPGQDQILQVPDAQVA